MLAKIRLGLFVHLEKCCKMSSWLEKSAKPRKMFLKMQKNKYLVAKIGVDAAENEPRKE